MLPAVQGLLQRLGLGDTIALGVVDADFAQRLQGLLVFDKFGNGLDTECLSHVIDGVNHGVISRVAGHVLDETAVEF